MFITYCYKDYGVWLKGAYQELIGIRKCLLGTWLPSCYIVMEEIGWILNVHEESCMFICKRLINKIMLIQILFLVLNLVTLSNVKMNISFSCKGK